MRSANPFRPRHPARLDSLFGREPELEQLRNLLRETSEGNASHFLITGEPGIGKTSLLGAVKSMASGHSAEWSGSTQMLAVDFSARRALTSRGLVDQFNLHLFRRLAEFESARSLLSLAWRFLQRVEAAGFKVSGQKHDLHEDALVDELALLLADLHNRVCGGGSRYAAPLSASFSGILILVDDIDCCGKSLSLGTFLKVLLEQLYRERCTRVALGLAGGTNASAVLDGDGARASTLFKHIHLERLSPSASEGLIDHHICSQSGSSQRARRVTSEARCMMVAVGDGHPRQLQEVGFAACAADTDGTIDEADVKLGVLGSGGPLDVQGMLRSARQRAA